MARGVRGSVNYDTEIAKLETKIKNHEDSIKSLKAQRTELLTKKQDNDMKELYSFMSKEGLSAEDILKKLKVLYAQTLRNIGRLLNACEIRKKRHIDEL